MREPRYDKRTTNNPISSWNAVFARLSKLWKSLAMHGNTQLGEAKFAIRTIAESTNSGKAEVGCAQVMSTYAVPTRDWSPIFNLEAKDRLRWTIDPICTELIVFVKQ